MNEEKELILEYLNKKAPEKDKKDSIKHIIEKFNLSKYEATQIYNQWRKEWIKYKGV